MQEIEDIGAAAAFVSTPSIYFSVNPSLRARCKVFDLDTRWARDPGFIRYDFNEPSNVPAELHGTFDVVVVDPPFVTRDAWEKYAQTVRLLLKPGGRVILTTIAENAEMMNELLGVRPNVFKPSIPHLVYQYNLYTNYDSQRFCVPNSEIPE